MEAFNKITFDYAGGIDEAFPPCDPKIKPLGSRILVQIRTPMRKTKGGIHLTDDSRETEMYNTQIGKVIDIGPVAFKKRDTLAPWPEGDWFKIGDFVRCPKYGGDRWSIRFGPDDGDEAIMVIFEDHNIIGLVTGDPLSIKAFL